MTYSFKDAHISSVRLRSRWYGGKWRTECPCLASRPSVMIVLCCGFPILIREYSLGLHIQSVKEMLLIESQLIITFFCDNEVGP